MTVRVVDAAESAAHDRAAIDGGTPSRALMQRAGAAAAAEIARRFGDRMPRGVAIFAGPGNNGGDAWVVAGALAAVGVRVRIAQVADPKTDDARAERAAARVIAGDEAPTGAEAVVVDGLLGTGSTGRPRGAIGEAIGRVNALRRAGAAVVALDLPSGVDATTGAAEDAVAADLTITFGSMKRGLLVARQRCGQIVVVDIGLGAHPAGDAPELVDHAWVASRIPRIDARAHKGTRGRLAILGGGVGMAGASVLAARAAVRSGVGMVRLVVHERSLAPVQASASEATAAAWPATDAAVREAIGDWAHAVVIGPGLGRSVETRGLVERVLRLWRGPVVLDADALNVFEDDAAALGALLGGRPAVITPHVAEFSRLTGVAVERVLDTRFDAGGTLAATLGAVVLLKGVPTVVTAPDGRRLVSAAGAPALAAAGSGDVLAGIAGTLVAQMDEALAAGACAAWVHGRAGELAQSGRSPRGTALDDVIAALPVAWSHAPPVPRAPVLAELPAVDDRAFDRR